MHRPSGKEELAALHMQRVVRGGGYRIRRKKQQAAVQIQRIARLAPELAFAGGDGYGSDRAQTMFWFVVGLTRELVLPRNDLFCHHAHSRTCN